MNPLRIMIVDDSAIVRGMLSRRLGEQTDFMIAATAVDGQMALDEIQKSPVDVVILDLEMPRMDGFTALPEIRRLLPEAKILISSTLTERNADIALKALSMGANDYVSKPSSRQKQQEADVYYQEIVDKIRALTGRSVPAVKKNVFISTLHSAQNSSKVVNAALAVKVSTGGALDGLPHTPTQCLPLQRPLALAIASSTGGPQALLSIFGHIGKSIESVPVFVTQHMPATFTTILAKHIHQASGLNCHEAEETEEVKAGCIYIAPGDFHLRVRKETDGVRIRLGQDAAVNYCRPAADPMIASLVEIYQSRLLLLVLTGMGQDGMEGARLVMQAGGTVVAQDKASSTVWGMPRAVAEHGYCKGILSLADIGPYLQMVFGGGVHAAR
ncbi:MAG: chemotaxis-specific protein-glutamate methyltransferase CheB [Rickettsiales bacterium]|nr:chemotaxis-specific protein-glutamate methyltransferase CheB [Rickettsiales bacterium]